MSTEDSLINPPPLPLADEKLAELTLKVRRALEYTGSNPPNWVPARDNVNHDVAIIGGGQTGVATGFALRRAGICNFTIIDQSPAGNEGVWRTCARMKTLRSPKHLPGPELGLDSLTLRSWYEAKYSDRAYADIRRCGTALWADYVDWFRSAVGIGVRNSTTVESIEPVDGIFRLEVFSKGVRSSETARKIVLATGMAGSGLPYVPAMFAALPRALWIHTDDIYDFGRLKGRSVGILGAASSAFDAAATALEQGAAEAHLFVRHGDLAHITRIKGTSYPGAMNHFHELPDADRWSLMKHFLQRASGPIADTVRRATNFPNFFLHFSAPWKSVRADGDLVFVDAAGKQFLFDMVIAGTGYRMCIAERKELAAISSEIALWRHRFTPPAGQENQTLADYPYLGKGFEFLERNPGSAPYLKNMHCMNNAALLSFGRAVGEITSIGHSVPRLVDRIGADFLVEDRVAHIERMRAFNEPDLSPDDYQQYRR